MVVVVAVVVVADTVVVVQRSWSAWPVKCCSGWTLRSGRPGGRERLVVDRVVSLGVKVKHAGQAGGRLVGWKNGLQEHAEARKDARGGKKGKRKGFVGLTCILDCVMAVQLRLMWRLTLCKDFQEEEERRRGGVMKESKSCQGSQI